jgi:Glycosyl hydrolases family 39
MWYFEVWNEPNLPSFFRNGTQTQCFDLYKLTVETSQQKPATLTSRGRNHWKMGLSSIPSVVSQL